MNQSILSPPDPFSLFPYLALLPVVGEVNKLLFMKESLYARYEKVKGVRAELSGIDGSSRFEAEERMLKAVLDWLESHVESELIGVDEE